MEIQVLDQLQDAPARLGPDSRGVVRGSSRRARWSTRARAAMSLIVMDALRSAVISSRGSARRTSPLRYLRVAVASTARRWMAAPPPGARLSASPALRLPPETRCEDADSGRHLGRLRHVRVEGRVERARAQERERDRRPARVVRHDPDEPVGTAPPGDRHVLADLACEDPRLVPARRHDLQELCPRLAAVGRRRVRDHLQRAIEHHVHRQVVGPRADDERGQIAGCELPGGHVPEAAGRVVPSAPPACG